MLRETAQQDEEARREFVKKLQLYNEFDKERILRGLRWVCEHRPAESGFALGVAAILTELNMDADTVTAALLRDYPAGSRPPESEEFGPSVWSLVEGLARIADIPAGGKTIHEAENIRKMLFAMVKDIRVIFIKLADKLHRMRTLDDRPPERRKTTAQECLDIYAPLAGCLGISWMKDELEDLSLKYLNRDVFLQIKEIVSLKKSERQEFLDGAGERIKKEAAAAGIAVTVESRAKHFYSIYQKMRRRNKRIEDIYDLFGIRILCDSIESCYTLLGMAHRLWKPLEGRFKDYIAMEKSNGYRSLHTTVMASGAAEGAGQLLEIQIRTWEMHRVAEYGIAGHWLYKRETTGGGVLSEDIALVNRLKNWRLVEWENGETRTSGNFLEDIKRELLKDSIYVFTPQGKVIELPAGATALDFAYHIHTAIGEHCAGAKADGVIIPLSQELQNTQVVEILTGQGAHPHLNWLRLVKTAKARGKIRSWLLQNDDSVIIEKNILAKKKDQGNRERLRESPQRAPQEQTAQTNTFQVRVEDEKNLMIRFARCCNPLMGDPIVGYVSRGRGIIIHRKNCGNLLHIPDFAERRIDTEWENTAARLVKRFKVESCSSPDLFSGIEGVVRKYQGRLIEGRLDETGGNHLTGFFTVQLEQEDDCKKILKGVRGIPAVYSILALN
ncbi:MAG: RelA/SpoT family protein [Treponema sp.]|jgi:GTP pyrophosphokinase|nr:RelA/SpoT family protein [Treponema sp.]